MIADEEFFRLAPDGARRSFSCSSAPIHGEDGKIVAAVVVARDVSELRRSREQLAYLLPMLDQTGDAIIAFDPQWRLIAWNKGAERMYGRSAEEVLGRELESVLRLNVTDEQFTEIRCETAERGRWRGEVDVRREDGSRLSVESITVAIRGADGEITGYFAIDRDITERKRAEDAELEANTRTESILERISDAFVAVDTDWRYTYLNEPALVSAGIAHGGPLTRGDLLGKNCWEAFPELVGTTFDRELQAARAQQNAARFEAYSPRTDSWLEVHAYPSKDGLSIYSRDVTERKRTEEQLRYHASLLDNVEDGVIATDAVDFRITAWNKGAERLYGFSAEEVIGRAAREVATFPGDQARRKLEAELLETGRTRIEFEAHREDGSAVEVELIAVAVTDERGETTGYLGIHRDLSERQRARKASETRARQQALLADLTLRNLANGDLDALMDDAATLVAQTLELEMSLIGELLPGDAEVGWRAAFGWSEAAIAHAAPGPANEGSLVGYTLLHGEPVISEDVRADERFAISRLLAEQLPVSAAAVVIPDERRRFGVLAAASRHHRAFSSEDVDFMQAVANVIGVAVERARVMERMEEARESVRVRIARDLHDEALRELTDALALATKARLLSTERHDEQLWATQIAAIQRAVRQLRSAVYDLRLGPDESRPFVDLLRDLVDIQASLALDCQIRLREEALPRASLGHRGTEVLRIIREAITNARLHSGATTIEVDGSGSSEGLLRLAVSDDGAWPDREPVVSGRRGAGIAGMLERADRLGAELRIGGRREGGTCVSLVVPLDRR
jgi:PAS domain S-box-containing protein